MEVTVELVNAFVANNDEGGNPAGVVLNADALSYKQKLAVAQSIGFSETAFISQDNNADFKVSFFTITDEIDFCGHATLAAFSVLYKKGIISSGKYKQRTKAGVLEVEVRSDGVVILNQKTPETLGIFPYRDIGELIGLDERILEKTNLPIEAISTGLFDLMVPVPEGYLDLIEPNHPAIIEFCGKHHLVGLHVFELCSQEDVFSARCRNFAPLVGIPEEAATGSSSGALACYLSKHVTQREEYLFEQGKAMKCSSNIRAYIKYDNGSIGSVAVGGMAKLTGCRNVVLNMQS